MTKDLDQNTKSTQNDVSLRIFSTDSRPYNVIYGEWTARWWQWVMSIPIDTNPLVDTTGKYCSQGQGGPVWYLCGTSGKIHSVERKCIIPTGKAILFPIIVSQFSYSEVPYIKTDQELIAHTSKDIDRWILLEATIDGLKLHDLYKYRVRVGPFDLLLPENNVWNIQAGATRAVSDGFWLFLEPLNEGAHSISFHGIEPHFDTKVTYHITITEF